MGVCHSLGKGRHLAVHVVFCHPSPSLLPSRPPQGLLQELCQSHDNDHLAELADQVLALLEQLPTFDPSSRDEQVVAMQLHTAGITLWNRGVALKSAGAISLTLNAQSEPETYKAPDDLTSNPLLPLSSAAHSLHAGASVQPSRAIRGCAPQANDSKLMTLCARTHTCVGWNCLLHNQMQAIYILACPLVLENALWLLLNS